MVLGLMFGAERGQFDEPLHTLTREGDIVTTVQPRLFRTPPETPRPSSPITPDCARFHSAAVLTTLNLLRKLVAREGFERPTKHYEANNCVVRGVSIIREYCRASCWKAKRDRVSECSELMKKTHRLARSEIPENTAEGTFL